jgi:U4/U6.U5 tri-snRNP-associated protein 2
MTSLLTAVSIDLQGTKYDLIANIIHEGKAGEGVYRLHVHRKVEEIW